MFCIGNIRDFSHIRDFHYSKTQTILFFEHIPIIKNISVHNHAFLAQYISSFRRNFSAKNLGSQKHFALFSGLPCCAYLNPTPLCAFQPSPFPLAIVCFSLPPCNVYLSPFSIFFRLKNTSECLIPIFFMHALKYMPSLPK